LLFQGGKDGKTAVDRGGCLRVWNRSSRILEGESEAVDLSAIEYDDHRILTAHNMSLTLGGHPTPVKRLRNLFRLKYTFASRVFSQ
jgi:hypothetical protein